METLYVQKFMGFILYTIKTIAKLIQLTIALIVIKYEKLSKLSYLLGI